MTDEAFYDEVLKILDEILFTHETPIELSKRASLVKTVLSLRASAMALAPSSPILL
jgi:hypothetical protein